MPSAQLLDTYSPELYCAIRNLHDGEPKVAAFAGGGNGYSLRSESEIFSGLGLTLSLPGLGLTLASGGLRGGRTDRWSAEPVRLPGEPAADQRARRPGVGAPGCWQPITRDLWPAPTLIMDTGNSLAPYNHIDTGSPYAAEYVWGRQMGDQTINP